jgi:hypothetical protein
MTIYISNHIPASVRGLNIVLSSVLLAYGTWGICTDDLYIPGKRSPGTHFHGIPAWMLFSAMMCAALNLLSVVADHYDIRNNERNYRLFARVTQILGWVFFVAALISDLFVFKTSTR